MVSLMQYCRYILHILYCRYIYLKFDILHIWDAGRTYGHRQAFLRQQGAQWDCQVCTSTCMRGSERGMFDAKQILPPTVSRIGLSRKKEQDGLSDGDLVYACGQILVS